MIETEWCFLKAKTKEAAMKEGLAAAEEFAYNNVDRYENPSGAYHGNFMFYDKVFNSEDEALAFFRSLGTYNDGVAMIKEPTMSIQTKYDNKVSAIQKKKRALYASVVEKFKERTSKTVGCKVCGTRIDKQTALERYLFCPVCNNFLVSDTVKARFINFKKQLKAAEIQYAKDCAEGGKIRYWAKYSVHC